MADIDGSAEPAQLTERFPGTPACVAPNRADELRYRVLPERSVADPFEDAWIIADQREL